MALWAAGLGDCGNGFPGHPQAVRDVVSGHVVGHQSEWPMVLIGDLGGSLKSGGRYLQMPHYGSKNHRTMAALYCTLLHAAGKPRDKFGVNDPGIKEADQSGVVAELLA